MFYNLVHMSYSNFLSAFSFLAPTEAKTQKNVKAQKPEVLLEGWRFLSSLFNYLRRRKMGYSLGTVYT